MGPVLWQAMREASRGTVPASIRSAGDSLRVFRWSRSSSNAPCARTRTHNSHMSRDVRSWSSLRQGYHLKSSRLRWKMLRAARGPAGSDWDLAGTQPVRTSNSSG
eukprot:482552-Pelagomonas_calceolata.AAC.7